MAYKTQYQGTSVKQFLEMDWDEISRMDAKELWDFSRQTVQAANKRLAKMQKEMGDLTPGAKRFVEAGGGKITMKTASGKTLVKNSDDAEERREYANKVNEMRHTIANLRRFMMPPAPGELSTRSWSDYKKYLKKIGEIIGESRFQTSERNFSYSELSEDSRRSLWNFIDRARSEASYGRTKEMGSDAFIKSMTEHWVSNGMFTFTENQNLNTVISESELINRRNAAARELAGSLGELPDFNSFGR